MQVLSINIVAALVVQVATQVGVQGDLEDLECHHQVVACLHQGWSIDHQARLVPMVHTVGHMVAHMEALMVVLMEVLMALMDLQAHMVLLEGLMDPTVPMVDPQDLMGLQAWVPTGLIKVLHVDLLHTPCKALDHEHLLLRLTFSDPCILEGQVLHHQLMVGHLLVDHHLT